MNEIAADRELDATGLFCPLPVLKANRLLREMEPGQVLKVDATDKGAEGDFRDLCTAKGFEFLSMDREGRVMTFHIRKA